MTDLRLQFLGQFQVIRGAHPVTTFESDKVRALLAYLAVEAEQAHSRHTLTALLWPDYEETSARASLRQALYQLRQIHLQALDALMILSDVDETAGELERAQRYARRQLVLEPWREETHRQIMRLLARTGQRGAALAHYQSCRQLLAAELGIEPSTATVELVEQIRTGAFLPRIAEEAAVGIHLPATVIPTPAPTVDPPFVLPEPITPFIDREKELAEVIERLQQPDVRLLTLVGAGGMGKTRLALQAANSSYSALIIKLKYRSVKSTSFLCTFLFVFLIIFRFMNYRST